MKVLRAVALVCPLAAACRQFPCKEGTCRLSDQVQSVQICASGYWQDQPRGLYSCVNGSLTLQVASDPFDAISTTSGSFSSSSILPKTDPITSEPRLSTTAELEPHITSIGAKAKGCSNNNRVEQTGFSYCSHLEPACRSDDHGIASYASGGKMASMYYRQGGSFRCDSKEPSDGLYVAFWTPYDRSLPSQPRPNNCGQKMTFKNPLTGTTAEAEVVDRCASCVGVNHQTNDATTPDTLVNGATVDLSEQLWNILYGNATGSVYDIEYEGPIWAGSLNEPERLESPNC